LYWPRNGVWPGVNVNDRAVSTGRGKPGEDCRRLPACPAVGGKRSAATDSDGRSIRLNAQQTWRDGCATSVRHARSASIRPSNGRTTLRRPCGCRCVSPAAFHSAGLRQDAARLRVVLPSSGCTQFQAASSSPVEGLVSWDTLSFFDYTICETVLGHGSANAMHNDGTGAE